MAIFSSKDFTGADTTRIRNMIAGILEVAAPATNQQCIDFVTTYLKLTTSEYEEGVQRAAISVSDPD